MHATKFTLFAVLIGTYITMIGAAPTEGGSNTGSIARRQNDDDDGYVSLQRQLQWEHGCSNLS